MSLYEATTDLHHDAEQHPWGQRMAQGEISRSEYADWLGALTEIHVELDRHLPPYLQRGGELLLDAAATLPDMPRPIEAAMELADTLTDPVSIGGAAYIFCGAHLRGGAVIRKRMEPKGFSCHHLRFIEAKAANSWLVALRPHMELVPGARRAFEGIIRIMDDIGGRHDG